MKIGIDGLLLWGQYSGVEHAIANLLRSLPPGGGHEYTVFVDREFDESGWPGSRFEFVRAGIASRSRARRRLRSRRALSETRTATRCSQPATGGRSRPPTARSRTAT